MNQSRAVIVLGMHRSGTSAVARGMAALGVALGDNLLAVQEDNPTGYWEDKAIVALNERLLAALNLDWTSVALIPDACWQGPSVAALRAEAVDYLATNFAGRQVWGFKDPRTLRLLPFWRAVLAELPIEERYVIAIRNPLSVARSLWRRQRMAEDEAHRLWLVYAVPYLHELAASPFMVIDYDLMMAQPALELARVAQGLGLPLDPAINAAIAQFSDGFLDPQLRHTEYSENDYSTLPRVGPLTREAYLWLRALATDRVERDAPEFWTAWARLREAVARLLRLAAPTV